jgi:hypothetical protein
MLLSTHLSVRIEACHNLITATEIANNINRITGLATIARDLKKAEFLVKLLTTLVGSLATGKQAIDALGYDEELQVVDGVHVARPPARSFADEIVSDDGSDAPNVV